MRKNCFIILDTNICVYRTLAYIQPRIINRDELEKVTEKIDLLTNNNFSSVIIISDTIVQELKNDEILFWEISNFFIKKLHHKKGSYQTLQAFSKAKKSILKFIEKYKLKGEIKENFISSITLGDIDKFYLKYPKKLAQITQRKLSYLRPSQQEKKKIERRDNLPEINDRLLLLESIKINRGNRNDVYIFSNDKDFTEFKKEIKEKFDINILEINDPIIEE